MISRENYILWFIDYADNKLSDNEKGVLRAFLVQNGDLQDEFLDFLEASKIKIEADPFILDTAPLHKTEMVMPTEQAADIRSLFEYTEGTLGFEETLALESQLANSPELQKELRLLEAARIRTDNEVFPDKKSLKKSGLRIGFLAGSFKYVSGAAAAAMVFWLGYSLQRSNAPTVVIQSQPGTEWVQKVSSLIEARSEEKALALLEEQWNRLPQDMPVAERIVYVQSAAGPEVRNAVSNTSLASLEEKIELPVPELSTQAPSLLVEKPQMQMASVMQNPAAEGTRFSPVKPLQNEAPFDLQLANSGRKKPRFIDVLSTIVTLGGVLDKKDTRMVTDKPDKEGKQKVYFYSKAVEAEFAVK